MVGRHDDGQRIITHEFDFSIPNQVVYEANGVKITSTPVDHYFTGGPVAYRVEWNDLVFTYSGMFFILFSLLKHGRNRRGQREAI